MLAIDYRWWVFVHLAGVVGFLLAHGVSVAVLFAVRRERDRDRIRNLLAFSGSTIITFYISLMLLLTGGIAAGFQGHWWSHRWIWIALGTLFAITVLMFVLARPYYRKIKEATELRPSGAPRVSDEELAVHLSSRIPIVIAFIGVGGLLAITWLMIFKPV